jgi:diadenosine tetraphosphate (Ap4A) HIT family hydrolase
MKSKKKITDIRGKTESISCIACSIQNKEVENPGSIAESKFFVAEQDYEIPIPGFVILISKRHLQSVDEFSGGERKDFIEFLCRLRAIMRKALKIKHVYVVQEEDTTTSHFHVWLFPRYQWMEKKFGRKIQSVRPIMEYARKSMKTRGNLKKVDTATQKLKQYSSRIK